MPLLQDTVGRRRLRLGRIHIFRQNTFLMPSFPEMCRGGILGGGQMSLQMLGAWNCAKRVKRFIVVFSQIITSDLAALNVRTIR